MVALVFTVSEAVRGSTVLRFCKGSGPGVKHFSIASGHDGIYLENSRF
jgi:hypothetical protein